jgi:hypothetical protein
VTSVIFIDTPVAPSVEGQMVQTVQNRGAEVLWGVHGTEERNPILFCFLHLEFAFKFPLLSIDKGPREGCSAA